MLCCPNCTQTADAQESSFWFPRLRNLLIAAIYIGDVAQQEIVSTYREGTLAFFPQNWASCLDLIGFKRPFFVTKVYIYLIADLNVAYADAFKLILIAQSAHA